MSGTTSLVSSTPAFVPGTFDAQDVRTAAMLNGLPGLLTVGDLAVSQRAAGANMSVDIAAGRVLMEPGGPGTAQGLYVGRQESSYNTSSNGGYSWTAADATNPRIDILYAIAADAAEGGSYTGWRFGVADGTPNAGATHQLVVTYWPAIPTGAVPLAAIHVPALDTTLGDAQITNLNPIAGGRSTYKNNAAAETTTSATYARTTSPHFTCVYVPHTSAVVRVLSYGKAKVSVASGTQAAALFVNDTQLAMGDSNAAPVTSDGFSETISTLLGRYGTSAMHAAGVNRHMQIADGTGADATDVTTGMVIGIQNATPDGGTHAKFLDIVGLSVGWKVIEERYKTSANTMTVDDRVMVAQVRG